MKCCGAVLALVCLAGLAMLRSEARAMPVQCHPDFLSEVSPRIRKICAALTTIYELGSSMETFINEKAPVLPDDLPRIPLRDSGVKRQDVDHVFLRFG